MYGQGVFPGSRGPTGFVFQRRSPGALPLASPGTLQWFLQGCHVLLQLVYKIGLEMTQLQPCAGVAPLGLELGVFNHRAPSVFSGPAEFGPSGGSLRARGGSLAHGEAVLGLGETV